MQMAAGSMITTVLAGMAASAAISFSVPLLHSSEASTSLESARVWLLDGDAYIDEIRYNNIGEPETFILQIGARSQITARFVPTLPVTVNADQVHYDRDGHVLSLAYSDKQLLVQQGALSVTLSEAQTLRLAGAPVITEDGHRFGAVDKVLHEAEGVFVWVRLSGADGGLQRVPASCAGFVPDTRLVVVRTCNLAAA